MPIMGLLWSGFCAQSGGKRGADALTLDKKQSIRDHSKTA